MNPIRRTTHTLALVVATMLAMGSSPARADGAEWGFSPGIKLGYTPGYGITYGLEVSVIRVPDLLSVHTGNVVSDLAGMGAMAITRTWGIVFNLDTTFRGLLRLRAGVEWVGPFLGLESGPCLVRNGTQRYFGWGLTGWAGYSLYPYFTRTFVHGADDLWDIGAYLKTPLLQFRGGNPNDFDDDE